jgi:hypothetical protein
MHFSRQEHGARVSNTPLIDSTSMSANERDAG